MRETERQSTADDIDTDSYEGAEMLSLWELCYADGGKLSGFRMGSEAELVHDWLASKVSKVSADKNVYKKYCPVCRSRGIDLTDGVYSCSFCGSRYMFDESGEEETVWFRKIRKKAIT